jgi:hypothetical protein
MKGSNQSTTHEFVNVCTANVSRFQPGCLHAKLSSCTRQPKYCLEGHQWFVIQGDEGPVRPAFAVTDYDSCLWKGGTDRINGCRAVFRLSPLQLVPYLYLLCTIDAVVPSRMYATPYHQSDRVEIVNAKLLKAGMLHIKGVNSTCNINAMLSEERHIGTAAGQGV